MCLRGCMNKESLLRIYREYANNESIKIRNKCLDSNKCAEYINKAIKTLQTNLINDMIDKKNMGQRELLENILLITYVADIVMLESRNNFRKYEYMDFARRIGELWEPFCKIPFNYPLQNLELVAPPKFSNIKESIQKNTKNYIENLNLDINIKTELLEQFNIPWKFVDSGGIKLDLDLHFKQNNILYNCDFKSGFSSNEKGNTNRLLLVASIYNSIDINQKTIMFVRQKEDENNHYLQTLKNSKLWSVFCSNEAYCEIAKYTGFDLKYWITCNMDWTNDIDDNLKRHLEENNLLKYLTW